jgi:hypothetical protein
MADRVGLLYDLLRDEWGFGFNNSKNCEDLKREQIGERALGVGGETSSPWYALIVIGYVIQLIKLTKSCLATPRVLIIILFMFTSKYVIGSLLLTTPEISN